MRFDVTDILGHPDTPALTSTLRFQDIRLVLLLACICLEVSITDQRKNYQVNNHVFPVICPGLTLPILYYLYSQIYMITILVWYRRFLYYHAIKRPLYYNSTNKPLCMKMFHLGKYQTVHFSMACKGSCKHDNISLLEWHIVPFNMIQTITNPFSWYQQTPLSIAPTNPS